jgi:hypothetical protein
VTFELGRSIALYLGDISWRSQLERGNLCSVEGCFLNRSLPGPLRFGETLRVVLNLRGEIGLDKRAADRGRDSAR